MSKLFKVGDQAVVRNAAAFVGVVAGDTGVITDIQTDGTYFVEIRKGGSNIVIKTKQIHKFERI